MTMNQPAAVYVAASHPRHPDACEVARLLRDTGFSIVSTWHERPDLQGYQPEGLEERLTEQGQRDVIEIQNASLLVELAGDHLSHGGRHAEFGMAFAMGKPILLYGQKEHVFHYHPKVYFIESETFHDRLDDLAMLAKRVATGRNWTLSPPEKVEN